MAAMILLSCAAFASAEAALFSIAWLLVFSERRFRIPSIPAFAGLFAMIIIISIISLNDVRGGLSYFTRMSAMIVIAIWAYSEIKPGEILDTLVWLLGEKTGFELGLTAETAMTEIRRIPEDFRMARVAIGFKGKKFRFTDYIPVFGNILIITLRRAEEHGKVLAGRGYYCGGTHHYKFSSNKKDIIGLIFVFPALFMAFTPLVTYL